MTKSFISGGAGFLGSHVARHCLEMGHEVVVLDDLSGGFEDQVPKGARLVVGSVCDSGLVRSLFDTGKFDYVYHLAAYAAEGLSHFIRRHNYENNVVGSMNVINGAVRQGVERFVFTSSIATFGHGRPPFKETDLPRPCDPYGIAKYAVELDLAAAHEMFGLEYTIFRPYNCYDDETEILTGGGFKRFADLVPTDGVATLNPDSGFLEYHVPSAHQKIWYEGDLYHFASKRFDLRVTPDHRIWRRTSPKGGWGFQAAADLADSGAGYFARLGNRASWSGMDPMYVCVPASRDVLGRSMHNDHQNGGERWIDAGAWAEFVGWYVTEGCRYVTRHGRYAVSISQSRKANPQKHARIVELIWQMGFNPYVHPAGKDILVHSKQLYEFLAPIGRGAHNKRLPVGVKSWATPLLQRLYDAMMAGDGDARGNRYTTVSRQLADDFCEVALKLGRAASVSRDSAGCFRISVAEAGELQIGDNRTKAVHVRREHYSGWVYDVTVRNHIIFVRRNGKACWSSNCYGEHQNLGDPYRNVVGIFMRQAMAGEPFTVFGDGQQVRAFSYVGDVAPHIAQSVEIAAAACEVFNVGGAVPYSVMDLAVRVAAEFGVGLAVRHLPPRMEVRNAWCSRDKFEAVFGLSDPAPLHLGVAKMAAWAKQAGVRMSGKRVPEVDTNLPEHWR